VIALLLAPAAVVALPSLVGAGDQGTGQVPPPVTVDDGTDTIGVDVGDGGSSGGGGGGSGGTGGPRCSYTKAYIRELPDGHLSLDNDHPVTVEINGKLMTGYWKTCPGSARVLILIDEGVTVQDMIDEVRASIRRRVPQPVANINPAPEHGGFVNLGLWLAIDDPGPISAHAAAGFVSATATAQHVSTQFDFGNGDSVTCQGLGTPIEAVHPDLDTTDEGPCGYTYRQSSPDESPYQVTISSTYAVSYTSSGGSGNLGTITTSRTYPYDVDEIQTIGTRG
ncbi:MAG: hypothetical protein QNM02_06870, partial [Acidimicrobiia bacterium]|nr:hypothetical protein [Acidimicrobiia bacterium]